MSKYPGNPADAGRWLKRERDKRGWSTTNVADYSRAIARREGSSVALTQQSVSGFEQGNAKRMPDWLRYVQMAFEEGAPPEQQDQEPRDDLVYLRKVDIRFAMGDGATIEEYPSTSLVPFNLRDIQKMTSAPTERLLIASGHGNSMEPTLLKDDDLLINTTETKMGLGDLIWAFEYAGAGYIKRLRPVKREGQRKILILSDNPSVPIEEADPEDIRIVGKVERIVDRKL